MTRMGGGFGRRLYGHFLVEAGIISQEMNAPIKLIYNRGIVIHSFSDKAFLFSFRGNFFW